MEMESVVVCYHQVLTLKAPYFLDIRDRHAERTRTKRGSKQEVLEDGI